MSPYAKENRLLRQDNAEIYGQYCAQNDFTTALDVIDELIIDRGEQTDIINQQNKDITSLTHLLSIYHNANFPSGKDPKGYEDTKKFLAMAEAYEEAKKKDEDGEISKEAGEKDDKAAEEDGAPIKGVQTKPCWGRPGHVGKSHNAKSEYTTRHTAEMCGNCGSTNLELLKPINRLTTNCGESGENGEDTKCTHTDRVTFGMRSGPPTIRAHTATS